jgi:two-component system, LytTR family, sensor kinase
MDDKSFFIRYKLHHVVFWGIVCVLWFYLRYQDYPTKRIALSITIVKVLDLALIVYLTNYLLVPRLLYKKKYVDFVVAFLIMIVASSFVKMYLMGEILDNPRLFSLSGNLKSRLYENLISDFFLVLTGAAFKLIFDYLKVQQRLTEVAREKAETELSFLKSQINPHFLFNSLNSVYFLIHKTNDEARRALHKFSEMLRYQLYEVNDDKITIEKEIHYLKDYVDLQQLRKDEKYVVEFDCAPDVKGFSIEPLLLIPFVENAFKHISHHTDSINYIRVSLSRMASIFSFSVVNSREDQPTTETHGGIGMNNVKRRLELLYPGKHELLIEKTAQQFTVKLNLQLL